MTTATRRARTDAAQLLTRDYDWRDDATCRTVDPELFFPSGRGGQVTMQERQAKKVCTGCPVREECLEAALEADDFAGVRGGLSESERRGMARSRETAFLRCLEAQEYIEEQIELGVPRRVLADEMGVSYEIVRRAVNYFKAEREGAAA